jgi:NDP-sugar pyrophosphorylase family protein
MKAMVFAAGLGQRLRPLTDNIPKAMTPVAGRPMIEYPLLLLRHYGIREIIINLHHCGDKIEEHFGNGKALGLRINYSREDQLLDTGGALLKARPFLDGESFLVINSDVLIDISLRDLLAYHRERKPAATLVLRADALAEQYGAIESDGDGKIHRFLSYRLPGPKPAVSNVRMFTGVHVIEPKMFNYMDSQEPFSITRATYPKMLLSGEPLCGFTYEGFWQDLGTIERIREAEEKLKSGAVKLHYL